MERTDHSGGGHDGLRDQEDRVVSRRAGRGRGTPGSTATEADERAHRAADPDTADRPDTGGPDTGGPDTGGAGTGGTAEQAGQDVATDEESEPTRSE